MRIFSFLENLKLMVSMLMKIIPQKEAEAIQEVGLREQKQA
jgi:hypothetical protein